MEKIDLDYIFGEPKFVNTTPIYPVRVKDMISLYESSSCLLIPKNSMTDIKIIKMSYLAFLIEESYKNGGAILYDMLVNLIKIVTREENIQFAKDEKGKYIILISDKHEIHEREFDKLREIIAKQNLIETKNESTGSDFDKAKEKAKRDLARRNGSMADLEQQIIAYKCVQKETYENIKNLTIYQFRKEIERIDLIKSADILQSAQYSGMVQFKDGTKVPHWLDQIKDKNIDDDLVLSKAQLDQISQKNGLIGKI